jgi:hypothetical protein
MNTPIQSNFITLEIPLENSPLQMQQAIEIALKQWGDPLRWAVMEVDVSNQIAKIEAIVTQTVE